MSYYLLCEPLALRSWSDVPCALVDIRSGCVELPDRRYADVLELCNGRIDFAGPLIPPAMRTVAEELERAAVISRSETPGELAAYQLPAHFPARYVSSVHWSVTGRCNYACRHCCLSAPHALLGEPDYARCISLIDDMARCGIFNVSLTGGEPLLRPDIMDIVRHIAASGINLTTIYTNGALVNEDLLDALEALDLRPEFNMSYDGCGFHDWLRGVTGAQADVERAFALLKERGFPTGAEMCLHRLNRYTLRESVDRLATLGCRTLKVNPVAAEGEWLKQDSALSLSDKEVFELYLNYIPQYFADGAPIDIMLSGFFSYARGSSYYIIPALKGCTDPARECLCEHARHNLYISPDCRALPCMALAGMDICRMFPVIPPGGLAQCIDDSDYSHMLALTVSEYMECNPECAACEYAGECAGGCRASALSGGGDVLGRDRSTCELFRGGWINRLTALMRSSFPDIGFSR